MAYQVLSLKWRPQKFEDIVGQKHISLTLSNAIKLERLAHAFTFSGPRGVGKTTTARILAKKINEVDKLTDSFDIIEMDAASNRGIDEIRNLNDNVNYAPAHGKYKVYIIDEVHMLTKEAFNALLKTLEEPPDYVVFILCTTELYKMPTTIISRTQRFDFKLISKEDIVRHIKFILDSESIDFEDQCLEVIAEKSEGSMRDALSILDQMICLCDNKLTLEVVKNVLGVVDDKKCFEILQMVGTRESQKILHAVNNILSDGISIEDFIKSFNNYLRKIVVDISLEKSKEQNHDLKELDIIRIMNLTLKFQSLLRNSHQPRIALDVLMLKLSYLDNAIDISKFLFKKNKDFKIRRKENNFTKTSKKNDVQEKSNPNVEIKKEKFSDKQTNAKENKNDNINEENISNTRVNQKKKLVKEKAIIDSSNGDKNLTLESISKEWIRLLSVIESKNLKTANFLSESKLDSFKDNLLVVKVNKVSNFIFDGLQKNLELIEEAFFDLHSLKIKVKLIKGKLEKIKKENKVSEKDEQHPLFMDVLNKFEGELLR